MKMDELERKIEKLRLLRECISDSDRRMWLDVEIERQERIIKKMKEKNVQRR